MDVAEIAPDDPRLSRVFEVMAELRPHLSFDQFRKTYERALPQGYRVAALFEGDECRAVAGYRLANNLVSGYHMYVDDLVTGEKWRSHGYGRQLNDYLVDVAKREGCASVQLDSATHRRDAHRFYFRERYGITSFHFGRYLRDAPPTPEPPKDPR
jgi:GNAT superfamily N-acetyltransferase